MDVQSVPIGSIRPYDKNPRKNAPAVDKVAESIREFGFRQPIVVDKDGVIIVGHTRYKAAMKLQLSEVPVLVASDLTDDQVKAYRLADNKTAEFAEWDTTLLFDELTALQEAHFDMTLFGFEDPNASIEEDSFDIDAETEAITDPVSKRGSVWALGPHRLVCGDSTSDEEVAVLMSGRKAKMVFTDPPYNVDYGSNKMNVRWKMRKIENDHQAPDEWLVFCDKVADRLRENCDGDLYVWGASGPDGMRARLALVDNGAHWSATIIWKKNQLVLSPAKYQRMYEPAFFGWFGKSSFEGDRKQVELWEFDRPRDSKLHPTMKPIALCANGILNSSMKGDIVLDLFGGSGSTLIACEETGRSCYMMELDPRYCDVIVKRWEQMSGGKAVLVDG